MNLQDICKALKPAGQTFILPDNGDILRSYNSQDKYKKPMKVFSKYNILLYYYDKQFKQYNIDCSNIITNNIHYIFIYTNGIKAWLMMYKPKKKIIFSNDDQVVQTINKSYKEECLDKMSNISIDWTNINSCYYKINYNGKKNICCFDFDDTLVKLRTNKPLPNVINILSKLLVNNDIVVFSNQKGVSQRKTTNSEVQNLMDTFSNLDISFIYATKDDVYRKPMRGMLDIIINILPDDCKFKYYCGDAGGRKTDFSVSDLFFANNIGIKFYTPEEIFLNKVNRAKLAVKKTKKLYKGDIWINGSLSNPRTLIPIKSVPKFTFNDDNKQLIIMVGPQGSGKSTVSQYISNKYGYSIINGDTIGTLAKQKKYFKQIKNNVKGIIIDNTNPQLEKRDYWSSQVSDWDVTLIYFDIKKEISFHMTRYRLYRGGNKMPSIAIHIYYKYLEVPTEEEGTLIAINGVVSKNKFGLEEQNKRFVWR